MGRTLLITGATGSVSSALRAALEGSDFDIRAMIRDQAKAAPLQDQGVQVVVGDLDDPRSLPPVFKGVQDLWLLVPNGPRARRTRGVALDYERLVRISEHPLSANSNKPTTTRSRSKGRASHEQHSASTAGPHRR